MTSIISICLESPSFLRHEISSVEGGTHSKIIDVDKQYPEMARIGSNSINMVDFINRGNIRAQQEGIDLAKPLTPEQESFVKDHIVRNKGGSYFVDIQNKKGDTTKAFSYEYPNVKVSTILHDINNYFTTKTQPLKQKLQKRK